MERGGPQRLPTPSAIHLQGEAARQDAGTQLSSLQHNARARFCVFRDGQERCEPIGAQCRTSPVRDMPSPCRRRHAAGRRVEPVANLPQGDALTLAVAAAEVTTGRKSSQHKCSRTQSQDWLKPESMASGRPCRLQNSFTSSSSRGRAITQVQQRTQASALEQKWRTSTSSPFEDAGCDHIAQGVAKSAGEAAPSGHWEVSKQPAAAFGRVLSSSMQSPSGLGQAWCQPLAAVSRSCDFPDSAYVAVSEQCCEGACGDPPQLAGLSIKRVPTVADDHRQSDVASMLPSSAMPGTALCKSAWEQIQGDVTNLSVHSSDAAAELSYTSVLSHCSSPAPLHGSYSLKSLTVPHGPALWTELRSKFRGVQVGHVSIGSSDDSLFFPLADNTMRSRASLYRASSEPPRSLSLRRRSGVPTPQPRLTVPRSPRLATATRENSRTSERDNQDFLGSERAHSSQSSSCCPLARACRRPGPIGRRSSPAHARRRSSKPLTVPEGPVLYTERRSLSRSASVRSESMRRPLCSRGVASPDTTRSRSYGPEDGHSLAEQVVLPNVDCLARRLLGAEPDCGARWAAGRRGFQPDSPQDIDNFQAESSGYRDTQRDSERLLDVLSHVPHIGRGANHDGSPTLSECESNPDKDPTIPSVDRSCPTDAADETTSAGTLTRSPSEHTHQGSSDILGDCRQQRVGTNALAASTLLQARHLEPRGGNEAKRVCSLEAMKTPYVVQEPQACNSVRAALCLQDASRPGMNEAVGLQAVPHHFIATIESNKCCPSGSPAKQKAQKQSMCPEIQVEVAAWDTLLRTSSHTATGDELREAVLLQGTSVDSTVTPVCRAGTKECPKEECAALQNGGPCAQQRGKLDTDCALASCDTCELAKFLPRKEDNQQASSEGQAEAARRRALEDLARVQTADKARLCIFRVKAAARST